MRRFLGYWATREWGAMAEMFSEDCKYLNVPEKMALEGKEGVRQWLIKVFDHLTRIDVSVVNMVSQGEWILSERVDDHIVGNKHMKLPVMNATRVVDGKFAEFRDYYDRLTVKELGMVE
ncbi:nuclear transport factor 2 family protein [Halioxenophilus sp. WMMB6]|uniref:nuclear transport factor 2 family protein n=1 Tax=Halioxenophilus sp. WMMB6 TaxID=3073815 RepID=UPI00295E2D7E|nr:nuclear transport factor 2 family protein [Halioxenophilus sp. WMMB6]